MRADDIIIRIDGERVRLHTDLTNTIAGKKAGESVTLTIYRIPGLSSLTVQDRIPEGETLEITVQLELPAENSA